MIAKLVHYDLKATVRKASFFWAALIALAIYNHFTLKELYEGKYAGFLSSSFSVIFFIILLAVIAVMVLIMTINRFWKGLLGDEGYLMFTLPATTGQLVLAKGLSIMILSLLSVVVSFVSMAALLPAKAMEQVAAACRSLVIEYQLDTGRIIWLAAAVLFTVCSFSLYHAMRLYAVMSVGQLAPGRKKLTAFAVYFLLGFAGRSLSPLKFFNLRSIPDGLVTMVQRLSLSLGELGMMSVGLAVSSMAVLVLAALYFGICCRILNRRLNLE